MVEQKKGYGVDSRGIINKYQKKQHLQYILCNRFQTRHSPDAP